ncbi:MAG TPA: hypothetical protein V6C58_24760 [Allocoleopsis sp.]
MANPNLLDFNVRKFVLDEIKTYENRDRKIKSLIDYEVYNDRIYKYVYDKLAQQLTEKTVKSMPVVANLNVAKRIVDKKSSIYTHEPERSFTEITDADEDAIEAIYKDGGFNVSLAKANKYYNLRNQDFIQVVPKHNKLILRVLNHHHVDCIPDADDPEIPYAMIVSAFDKTSYINSDNSNQSIAERDDYKARLERYQVWTKEITFVMDGNAKIIGEIVENPIKMIPIVDVARDKDFEFFVQFGQALSDFTIDFNVAWSDVMYTNRLQGFSLGVLKGDPNLKPDDLTIGPNRLLFLPTNPDNPESSLDIDFKNPTPNLEASLKVIESLITTFLTTRGIDASVVRLNNAGSTGFSSALERLLAMLDSFEATKEDFDLFKKVEYKLFEIVKAWLNILSGTEKLDRKYWVTPGVVNAQLSVKFHEPQMLETKSEMLDNAKKEIDLGISDRVTIYAKVNQVSDDVAEERIKEIDDRRMQRLTDLANDTEQPETESPETEMESEDNGETQTNT